MCVCWAYLKILKVIRIARPVHLGKKILIQHLAEEFKQVHFALVVCLHIVTTIEDKNQIKIKNESADREKNGGRGRELNK